MSKSIVPMNRSGISRDMASQARTIDPRLCPASVKRRHVLSSTHFLLCRNTKCSSSGSNETLNRLYVCVRGVSAVVAAHVCHSR